MQTPSLKSLLVLGLTNLALIAPPASAQAVGTPGSNGLIPYIHCASQVIGLPTTLIIGNVSSRASAVFLGVSTETATIDLTLLHGPGAYFKLGTGPTSSFVFGQVPMGTFAFLIPDVLEGRRYYMQAFVLDPGAIGGVAFTDLYEFRPERRVNRSSDGLPLSLVHAAAVRDETTGRIFVLGGFSELGLIPSILTLDFDRPLGEEVRILPDLLPRPVGMASTVFDSAARVAYLLGGATSDGPSTEITRVDLARPIGEMVSGLSDRLPGPRKGAAVARDPVTGVAYLFGGFAEVALDEIVKFTPHAPPGQRVETLRDRLPSPRSYPRAAWDDATGKAYIFGGGTETTVLEFDPRRPEGQRVRALPEALPSPRDFSTVCRDPRTGVFYVFAGTQSIRHLDEVLAFDPAGTPGSRLSFFDHLPKAHYGSFALFDSQAQLFLIGGGRSIQRLREVTGFDPLASAGSRFMGPLSLPQGVTQSSAVIDPAGNVFVFGGWNASGYQTQITRIASASGGPSRIQVLQETLPTPRSQTVAVWDPTRHVAYVFGGSSPQGPLAEILRFDPAAPPGQAVQVLEDHLPRGLSGPAASWDPAAGVAWIFGGRDNYDTDLILKFDPSRPAGSRLTQASDRLPAVQSMAHAARDPRTGEVYLFGGFGPDIIRFDPSLPVGSRVFLLPDRLPSWRTFASAVFDEARNVFNIFGGNNSSPIADIVRFDPSRTQGNRVSIEETLQPPRFGTIAVRSPSLQYSIVIGGRSQDYLSEVWLYHRQPE